MLALFIAHHLLNGGWHKNLFRGKYNLSRILMLVINILLFSDMLGLMISGILLSNHVFAFLNIHGGYLLQDFCIWRPPIGALC